MKSGGLGEQASLYEAHPTVPLVFYVMVIAITMVSNNYIMLFAGLLCGVCYCALLKGAATWRSNVALAVFMVLVMSVFNGIFSHNGATVLFYVNGNRITMEAFIYGAVMALMVAAVVIWFRTFQTIVTSDKFIYIFGRMAPVIGLTLSMIFRFIPLLRQRYAEIRMGQQCMGRNYGKGKFVKRVRQFFKELSILTAWSLEASIESSDSMEARGYGLAGRTSFHLFKFRRGDAVALVVICILGGVALAGCIMGYATMLYYPTMQQESVSAGFVITLIAYVALMITPVIMDMMGERRWRRYHSEI